MTPQHNLPGEVASFVGRERATSEIARLLLQARLLTLTGAGGCGKTRLALRVAADLLQRFPDGVWLVSLAPLGASFLVPQAVAAALGVRGAAGRPLLATLTAALASRRLLLVLDNCEHLIGACARLTETLLHACPHLHILATSREPLRIQGEITWRVPALALPHLGPLPPPESLARFEAVALFLDRARARQPDFTLNAQTAPAVVAICRRLDGLPLAIELAAAQMGAMAPTQIASRLGDALRVLEGGSRTLPRQETLRASLDWSHDLLSEAERALFRRLSAFAGSFDLAAAVRVCGWAGIDPSDVPTLLTALVGKSLVEPLIAPLDARYRLLEPVRQYARARLAARGEEDDAQRRHALDVLALAEAAEPALMSGERGPWIERLAREQDNLRAALAWSLHRAAGGGAVATRLVGALFWYWVFRGDISEGADWVEAALTQDGEAHAAARIKALYVSGELAWLRGHYDLARARLEECEAHWRALGEQRMLAYTLQVLALVVEEPRAHQAAAESLRIFETIGERWGAAHASITLSTLALVRGDAAMAQVRLEETLARWRDLGDEWGMAQALNFLGDLARSRGDTTDAATCYEEALALLRRQGLTGTVPSLLHNQGYVALREGDTGRALTLFRESLALFRDQGDQRGIAECLAGLAGALGARRQPEAAARLLGAAEALRDLAGATVWQANGPDYARTLDAARGQLDAPAFAAAWAAGRALPFEQAVTEALGARSDAPSYAGVLDRSDGAGLTPREREVAALVARGLSNRRIGAALFITEGTARLHVKHILHKLGFVSRAQVAAWAVAQGLAPAPEAT